jgi:hypothetical protein
MSGLQEWIAKENSKFEYRNSKQARMSETGESSKRYDLDERTLQFARDVRAFIKTLPRTVANDEDTKSHLINDVVASLCRGARAFLPLASRRHSAVATTSRLYKMASRQIVRMHIKISRKEAKESRYWLRLLDTAGRESSEETRGSLVREATELMNIFGAIVRKSE